MSIYQITAICEEHATAADAVVERVFGNTESEVLKNEPVPNSYFSVESSCSSRPSQWSQGSDYNQLISRPKTARCAVTQDEIAIEAFYKLESVVADYYGKGLLDNNDAKNIGNRLSECRQYLRTDFRIHLKKISRVADHCAQHALSDPNDAWQRSQCTQADNSEESHIHDQFCDRCESCKSALNDVYATIENVKNNEQTAANIRGHEEILAQIVDATKTIVELKRHLVRSFWSDLQRQSIVEQLNESNALLTLDWAQKILPQRYLESQKVCIVLSR
jgi:hypothetical protein